MSRLAEQPRSGLALTRGSGQDHWEARVRTTGLGKIGERTERLIRAALLDAGCHSGCELPLLTALARRVWHVCGTASSVDG